MQAFKTKWFARFAWREGIADSSLLEAIERAEQGLMDADLGGGLIKQRVARKGQGRSGGYRTILAYRARDRAFFILGFARVARKHRARRAKNHAGYRGGMDEGRRKAHPARNPRGRDSGDCQ